MAKILGPSFFNRSAVVVAKDLIGQFLVCRLNGRIKRFQITETEGYEGPHDLASHASKGETTRTKPMFDPAGHLYIYLVYGMYEMLNVVTGSKGYPAAVLIRGVAGISGPGRITKALKITRRLNQQPASLQTGLWFELGDKKIAPKDIKRTTRIGVSYAGPIWSKKLYRFVLETDSR